MSSCRQPTSPSIASWVPRSISCAAANAPRGRNTLAQPALLAEEVAALFAGVRVLGLCRNFLRPLTTNERVQRREILAVRSRELFLGTVGCTCFQRNAL